jgi:creatinine amidohydrolase
MTFHKWEEITAADLPGILRRRSLAYVPVGSMEFHGPHLPLGTDTVAAYEFCLRVASLTGGLVLPPTYWNANGHDGWPGSLLVSDRAFRALFRDLFRLLAGQGVELVVASTGHWPQRQGAALARLARDAMRERPRTRIMALDLYTTNPHDTDCDHAGVRETSLMRALRPGLVHMDRLGGPSTYKGIGLDAAQGNAARGRAYIEASVRSCASIVLSELAAKKSPRSRKRRKG